MSARYYLIFIVFSFVVSVFISLFVVNNRVEQSISGVIDQHTRSSSELSTAMIEQYFSTRTQLAKDLSTQPILISSVMGAEGETGRLKDFIYGVSLLGKAEPIGLYDILGESVYSNLPKNVVSSNSKWLKAIIDGQSEIAILIVDQSNVSKFLVALPIKYNGLVEGVLTVLFSDNINSFLEPLFLQNEFSSVRISGPYFLYETSKTRRELLVVNEKAVPGTDLTISYLLDEQALLEEQLKILVAITLSIIGGLILSFFALGLLGHRLLLNPYKKLEALQIDTEEALRELENLNYSVDQHSIVAITDVKGTIIFANEKFSEISGYSNEELVGKNHRILNSGYHDKQFFVDMYKTISKGSVFRADICNRTKQGAIYWVDTTINPLKDAAGKINRYIAIRSDITKLKLAEEKIVSDNLRMQLATNASGIGIWEWDLKSNELVWDDWMYSLYGLSPSMFTSTYEAWEACLLPEDLDPTRRALQDAIDGHSTFEPEFRIRQPNGSIKTLKAKAQIFRDNNGHSIKMIGVNYDISDRVKALEMISEARDKAQKAAEAKSEFLANMSHEIRTPMNGVIGMLELLKQTDMNKDQTHKLKVAASSAQSLLTLLNDILDLSKIEAGKLELEYISFDLNQLLCDSVEALTNLVDDSQSTQLLIDTVAIKNNMVVGDPGRIRQIVTNLLSNAIKFTAKGDIVLTAALEEKSDQIFSLKCSVKDSGIGIPKDKLSTLFKQFTQVDASTTRKYGGTGLGLSICKHLCHLMDGEITVTSEQGRGSCFTFDVELRKPLEYERNTYPPVLNEMNVLLIDKNDVSREILERQLSAWGILCDSVANYSEANALMTAKVESSRSFDIILMDSQDSVTEVIDFCATLGVLSQSIKPQIIVIQPSAQSDEVFPTHLGLTYRFVKKPVIPSLIMDMLIESSVDEAGVIDQLAIHNQRKGEFDTQTNNKRRLFKQKVRVLLVEDNQVNQLVAQALLTAYGLDVVIANNGKEALDILTNDTSSTSFALALMDCHMPEMDGYDTTKNIRAGNAGEKYEKLPVIAMTANAMQGDREKCLQAGMDDYVTKPINETLLQNALLKWVDDSELRQGDLERQVSGGERMVLNKNTLLDRLDGDTEKLSSIIKNYLKVSEQQKQHIVETIRSDDNVKAKNLIRSVRNRFDQLGGEVLKHVLTQIEVVLEDESLVGLDDCVEKFESAHIEFNNKLGDYLNTIS